MMRPRSRRARSSASADLPLAVGPAISTAFTPSDREPVMSLVATLICNPVNPALDSTIVFNELLKRGVIVKDGTDIPGLGARYLRVDVNLQKHMDRFLAAMEDIRSCTAASAIHA